jgi:hypothetical protein
MAVESVEFVNSLVSIKEVHSFVCDNAIQCFKKSVLVELVVGCNLVDRDLPTVAQAFVDTYNGISQDHYCEPFVRTLESAEVITRGLPTPDGNLPLEIQVTGYCRGCDPLDMDIYDLPTTMEVGSRFLFPQQGPPLSRHHPRRLGDFGDTCFCSMRSIGIRAPSEAEFIQAFQVSVESLQDRFGCVESVADCQFGSFFETAVVVAFDNVTFADEFQDVIEGAFLSTLNRFYETTEAICNPEFRLIQSVESIIGVKVNQEYFDRRELKKDSSRRNLQDNHPSLIPSAAPTTVFGFSDYSESLNVLIYVSGICKNGCTNDIILTNQVTDAFRRILSQEQQVPRFLQNEELVSNCFCPITAELITVRESSSGSLPTQPPRRRYSAHCSKHRRTGRGGVR